MMYNVITHVHTLQCLDTYGDKWWGHMMVGLISKAPFVLSFNSSNCKHQKIDHHGKHKLFLQIIFIITYLLSTGITEQLGRL